MDRAKRKKAFSLTTLSREEENFAGKEWAYHPAKWVFREREKLGAYHRLKTRRKEGLARAFVISKKKGISRLEKWRFKRSERASTAS